MESTENEYIKLFQEAKSNATLAECIKDGWKLSKMPIISNLKIKQVKSDDEMRRLMSQSLELGELNQVTSKEDELDDLEDNTDMNIAVPTNPKQSSINEPIGEDD